MSLLSKAGNAMTGNVSGIFGIAAVDSAAIKPEVVLGIGSMHNQFAGLDAAPGIKFDM